MIKDVLQSIVSAARKLFTNAGAALISFLLYAAVLLAIYTFITLREASFFEVLLSMLILPLAVVILFFAWQAMGVSYVRIGVGPFYLLRRALRDIWKMMAISLPLLALGWLVWFGLGKLEAKSSGAAAWLLALLAWAKWVWLYLVLPLTAIHWWIAAVREGLGSAYRGALRNFARAVAPRSLLIYVVLAAASGALVQLLLFKTPRIGSEWVELSAFGLRLALAALVVFCGWLITLGAMAELTARRASGEFEPLS